MPEEILELTDEQKKKILDRWNDKRQNPPSLKDLCHICFGAEADGRDKRAKAIKKFLADRDLKVNTTKDYQRKGFIELSEEQKQFIANSCSTMSSVEIARTLFNNNRLNNLSQETRTVASYIQSLNPKVSYSDPQEVPQGKYKPPKTSLQCISRINKYIHEPMPNDEKKLTAKQKRDVQALIGHLHAYRFNYQINTYSKESDRELFESTFIRYVYNKAAELTPEEVDQFLVLCIEVVISANIQARIEMLQKLQDNCTNDTEDNIKISMSLVEAIKTQETQYNQSVMRQQKLFNDLNEKRSDRLKNQIKENESLITLIESFREYEKRKKLVDYANLRKQKLKEEADKLENMDSLKAEIFGVEPNEIINS